MALRPTSALTFQIESWAKQQNDKPSRLEAIRRLIEFALAVKAKNKTPTTNRRGTEPRSCRKRCRGPRTVAVGHLLWRLRCATTIETGLFDIQADHLSGFRQGRQVQPASPEIVYAMFERADAVSFAPDPAAHRIPSATEAVPNSGPNSVEPLPLTARVAFCVSPTRSPQSL
ncbi:MAG: hypothetical protein ACLPTZ_05715 [Beijerinckiaceae bacterium]